MSSLFHSSYVILLLVLACLILPSCLAQDDPQSVGVDLVPAPEEVDSSTGLPDQPPALPSTIDLSDGFLPPSDASSSVSWDLSGAIDTIDLAPAITTDLSDVVEGDSPPVGSSTPFVLADIPALEEEAVERLDEQEEELFEIQEEGREVLTGNVVEGVPTIVTEDVTEEEFVSSEGSQVVADEVEEHEFVELDRGSADGEIFLPPIVDDEGSTVSGPPIVDDEGSTVSGETGSVTTDVESVLSPTAEEEESTLTNWTADQDDSPAVEVADGSSTVVLTSSADEMDDENTSVDPRVGVCTKEELESVKDYFIANENECSAYQCVARKTQEFFEFLNLNYPDLWKEGGDSSALNSEASLLAACTCRCDMMKCEVDYMATHASDKCFGATVEYCGSQNELFVARCSNAYNEYKLAAEFVGKDARWQSSCPGACSPSDPVGGLAFPVASGESSTAAAEGEIISSGEQAETAEHNLNALTLLVVNKDGDQEGVEDPEGVIHHDMEELSQLSAASKTAERSLWAMGLCSVLAFWVATT